jgi:predicted AAA+ superfamily ATPase
MEFKRSLELSDLTRKKSFFLFGPRGTGKSYLIRQTFKEDAVVINLLKTMVQLRLAQNPGELEGIVDESAGGKPKIVVIDEIQKLPVLLDEVHRLIEERKITFLLTGSSARSLKKSGVNLLAGRAWVAELFPLTFAEIPGFDLDRFLRFGGLPAVVSSDDPEEQLDAYVQTYLNEEIKAESLVRKIPAFVEFLRFAALSNTQIVNYAGLASDAGVSPPTIASYFQILEDTMIAFQVRPWKKPTSRKSIASSKIYFFDTGVANTLAGTRSVDRNSNLFGTLFEQWIAMELRAFLSYRRVKEPLMFWRTEDGIEVDFIVDGHVAIEVKAGKKTADADLKSLRLLQSECRGMKTSLVRDYYLVSNDPIDRIKDGIHLLHWQTFMKRLWTGDIIQTKRRPRSNEA